MESTTNKRFIAKTRHSMDVCAAYRESHGGSVGAADQITTTYADINC